MFGLQANSRGPKVKRTVIKGPAKFLWKGNIRIRHFLHTKKLEWQTNARNSGAASFTT
jgi:hypothetical protein